MEELHVPLMPFSGLPKTEARQNLDNKKSEGKLRADEASPRWG